MQLWKDFTFKTKNFIKLKVRKNTIEKVSTQKSGKIKKKQTQKNRILCYHGNQPAWHHPIVRTVQVS